jgi:uncharacterized Zn finger protein
MRDTIPEKAARFLSSGAVHVQRADGTKVAATVEGDGRYVVVFDGEGWACSCAAWKSCSHAAAVELVAAKAVAA